MKGDTMTTMKLRLFGIALGTGLVLTLTACGGSPAAATDDAGGSRGSGGSGNAVTSSTRQNEPPPPADYVRSSCHECSCRVFTGDKGYCRRPSCRHHWTDHQRPPQG